MTQKLAVAEPGRFHFRLLGPFAVARDGRELAPREIGSRKGRTLLKILLLERGHFVPSDVIVETLWGEGAPERPERHVATLISRLRTVFGSGVVDRGPSGYRFVPSERFEVDADEAERLVDESEARMASRDWTLARTAADGAVRLLGRGILLEDEPYAAWSAQSRPAAEQLLRRARRSLWSAALELGDSVGAARAAADAVAHNPLDEEACRAAMIAHQRAGRPADAIAVYEKLRAHLAEQLGVDPSPETRALHLAVLREEPGAPAIRPPAPSRRISSSERPFVDRAGELDCLEQDIEKAVAGHKATVLISGEAGIGKTRLATEVVHAMRRRGGVVLQARCHESERSIFVQPIADAIRTAVLEMPPDQVREAIGIRSDRLIQLVPEIGTILERAVSSAPTSELGLRGLFDEAAAFLRALATRRPVLLFLDDLQHAGSSTLEFLHFVAARMEPARVLIIATVRAESGDEVHFYLADVARYVDLGPLSESGVAQLAQKAGVPELGERVMKLTRGHTQSVAEILRACTRAKDTSNLPIPEALRRTVLRRVKSAGADVEALLRVAAILGTSFDLSVAGTLLGVSVQEAIRRAERAYEARLVVEAGSQFEFASELVREIVYRSTPLPVRIARHRHAASLAGSPVGMAAV